MSPLIEFTEKGLYCREGDFYIDPWLPVDRAVITHAHSDHARWGNKYYLCQTLTKPILQARLGEGVYESVDYHVPVFINGVRISFHPSGHVIGAAQVRVEYNDDVWVVSGDYKTADDGISGKFEVVPCRVFITESTFGLPIYRWKPQEEIYENMRNWVQQNIDNNINSVLLAYSLGKAQRVMHALAPLEKTFYVHGAVWNMHEALLAAGVPLPKAEKISIDTPKEKLKGSIIIAPPGAEGTPWMRKLDPYSTGVCSGWMQVRGNVRRRNPGAGFVLSDHADWDGLLEAVKGTGAEKVFVTHGFQAAFSRYLNEIGIESGEVKTAFGNEEEAELKAEESI
ncbi:MAG: ligase-associated DNA damage response exonuclease [Ginsengibacter sp.]